jgi:hypothetical protein
MSRPTDESHDPDPWGCGWESNRKRQLAIGLDATPAQRLAWVCAMIELAWRTGALPKRRPNVWGTFDR